MSLIARDDLAKIEFRLWRRLGYGARLTLAGALVVGGVLVQLLPPGAALWGGGLLVLAGAALLLVKSKSNAPPKLQGERAWERVTPEQFGRVRGLVERGKAWAGQDAYRAGGARGCATFIVVTAAAVAVWAALAASADARVAAVWALDAGLFLTLTFFAGIRSPWEPKDLLIKIDALQAVLTTQAAQPVPRLTFQPMLEVLKDPRAGQLPQDARLLVTVDGAPADLVGFQVQCSINRVQSAAYPYVYAVIIARKAFRLAGRLADAKVAPQDVLTVEEADREMDVAVIRQRTSKSSGYHTRPADQVRIVHETAMLALWLATHSTLAPDVGKPQRRRDTENAR